MFCIKCGAKLPENAEFCPECGAKAVCANGAAEGKAEAASAELFGSRVTLCADGKYRWRYDMSLFKNPTVFILVFKILFFIFIGIFAFITVVDLLSGNDLGEAFENNLKVFGIIFLVMLGIFIISYLIYAAIMGGKYCVEFEMDENGVNHRQIDAQAEKARKIRRAARFIGSASGSMITAGAGTAMGISPARAEMYSEFSKVKRVKVYPSRELIKLNETLIHNQVYVPDEDFDFVKDHIIAHCENLKG